MTDWESDKELAGLREDFIRSFSKRWKTLFSLIEQIARSGAADTSTLSGAVFEVRVVAHNLAGSASTYGFHQIGEVATALDDFLSLNADVPAETVIRFSKILLEAIEDGRQGRDSQFKAEALGELISCAKAPASGAKP